MCGIAGIFDTRGLRPIDRPLLERMNQAQFHRGPDEGGTFVAPGIGLAHRRLSIIDVSTGQQPLFNQDRSICIVFNGEIYNFQQVRAELQALGHVFQTHSDTEVIVQAWAAWGEDCVRKLRGMFAFAIWDQRRRSLLLARDRLGKKPLVYCPLGLDILFGSEIKAILASPSVPRRLRLLSLHDYLTYQYVPHPHTMFDGILKLPPGHTLLWKDGHTSVEEYWRPPFGPPINITLPEASERIRDLLDEATRIRLMSEVPLGAFLSGGIDSSIVVALMARHMPEPVKTFSIGFEEKRYDELKYARLAAQRIGADHHEFIVRPDAVEILPKLAWHYDEPFADSSAVPTYYVSQQTRQHVTVALTGDAGDEGFAGYSRYKAMRLAAAFDHAPHWLRDWLAQGAWRAIPDTLRSGTLRRRARRFLAALALDPCSRYTRWCCAFDDELKAQVCSEDMQAAVAGFPSSRIFAQEYAQVPGLDFVARTLFVDYRRYLPDDLNLKVDIASMAHSLECRSPFLDHRVVEFAATLPTRLKLRGMTSKFLLKHAFRDLLPKEILHRPKMGFGVPIAEWFRGPLKDLARDTLLSPAFFANGWFSESGVRRLVDDHTQGRHDHGYRLWALLMFELWRQRFIS